MPPPRGDRGGAVRRGPKAAPLDVCVVSSHGGHLELAVALAPAYSSYRHLVVTGPGPQADALAADAPVKTIVNPGRDVVKLLRNSGQAAGIVRRHRPSVVISTGAGMTVPLCLAAKARGATLIFVETMARVSDASATGRVMEKVADHHLVQWPELRGVYPRAEVCRPALLEMIADRPASGRGTFLATGTHAQPFDRLLRWADEAAGAGLLPAPVLAQAGPSRFRPKNLDKVAFMRPVEVEAAVDRSAVVVGHAGSGLVSMSLRRGRRPLVMARRAAHGEHVDDHQVIVARKLASMGLIVDLDATDATDAIAGGAAPIRADESGIEGPPLADRLADLTEAALAG